MMRLFASLVIVSTSVVQVGLGQDKLVDENVDHAGIISRWDRQSLERGRHLFQIACAPCHGTNGVNVVNPQARPFAREKFQNGNDPYSMFKTITKGFKNMPSQTWMTPEQRYEVIQFLRETIVRPLNPSQYTPVDRAYLDSLPRYDPAQAGAAKEAKDQQRDFGPALESQLGTNFADVLTIRLKDNVNVSYDLHHMRLAGAWQGGFLDLSRTGHFQQRGEGQPLPQGKPLRGLQQWYWAFGGRFDYSTDDLLPRGPLPAAWMKYQGHYVSNDRTILAFTIEGRQILELPEAEKNDGALVISHTLSVGPGPTTMKLCVGQSDAAGIRSGCLFTYGGTASKARRGPVTGHMVMVAESAPTADPGIADKDCGNFVAAGIQGSTTNMSWEIDNQQRLVLIIPPDAKRRVLRIFCSSGNGAGELRRFGELLLKAQSDAVVDPQSIIGTAVRQWPLELTVRGLLGRTNGAYALDTIPLPQENPYGAWLRTSALAFFPDGRAVVTTYGGDVWLVSGLDHSLKGPTWSRFAAGLYEPFGVQVVDGLIYVTCRNGIVRLHDLNQDGEADYYETWYADTDVSKFFHAFNFDLLRDHRGHFYYAKPGEYTDCKLPGAVIEIWPDGSRAEIFCTGFRVPNGMGISPDDSLTVSDNQGDWMPASKISLVRRGGFYGYVQTHKGGSAFGDSWAPDGGRIDADAVRPPPTFDQPIIWMPQEFDNSSSGQLWVGDARFGPLSGRLLHTSFGKGWMYYLIPQAVGNVSQAAIVALPFQFEAGLMRARVNPGDGQVYATGLSGWQGPANGKDGCLQRLRYTAQPIKMLEDLKVHAEGLALRFNFALNRASALNLASYHLEQWNYLWSSKYGSDQYSVEHPNRIGHDPLNIQEARLSDDGRQVFLTIPKLRPVHQVEIRLDLKAADGASWKELVYLTINAVPAP